MLEPRAGLEPATCRLRIGCSTTELPRPLIIKDLLAHFCPLHKTAIKLPSVHFPIARDLVQNCSLPSRTAIIVRSNSAVLLQPYVTESDQTLAQGIRSTHSTSLSCPIANNVNRNNINTNNVNRNNINSSNYRANNFNNTSHNSYFTTPNFGTQHNQAQFRNTNGATLGQQAGQRIARIPALRIVPKRTNRIVRKWRKAKVVRMLIRRSAATVSSNAARTRLPLVTTARAEMRG